MKRKRTTHRTIWENSRIENMNEGLIKSWSNKEFINAISKVFTSFNIEFDYDLDEEDRSILLNIERFSNIEKEKKEIVFNKIQQLLKQSGYYSIAVLKKEHFINSNSSVYNMEFIKKFNVEAEIPKDLFHISHPQYKNKILKNGLVPKSKKLIEDHPERVYFTDSLEDAIEFAELKYKMTKNEEFSKFIIFKIDGSSLNIKLYIDGLRMPGSNMYFTHENISPKDIKLVYSSENQFVITEFNKFRNNN